MTKSLPPEIWKLILRHAATDSHALCTSPIDPLCDYPAPWEADPFSPEYFESMRAKSVLALVCKYWRVLATDLLFERVRIRDLEGLRSLKELFDASATESLYDRVLHDGMRLNAKVGGEGVSLVAPKRPGFWYTRRCDLDLRFVTPTKTQLADLVSVVRRFTNLRVLDVSLHHWSTDGSIVEPIEILLQTCTQSLRCFRMSSETLPPSLVNCLLNFEALEILSLSILDGEEIIEPLELEVALPNLHTLLISGEGVDEVLHKIMVHCDLPSLRRLTVAPTEDETFFSVQGSQIVFLELLPPAEVLIPAAIFTHCPVVEHLVVGYGACPHQFQAPNPSGLCVISIHTPKLRNYYQNTFSVMEGLENWINLLFKMDLPSLFALRLLDFTLDADFASEMLGDQDSLNIFVDWVNEWMDWIARWRSRDVRFEDSSGDLIEVPEKLLSMIGVTGNEWDGSWANPE